MVKLSVFDSPSCCSTGVCGPDADETQAQFTAALDWAQKKGIEVERFNLSQQPGAFAENQTVKGLLDSDGMDCLPLVIVDGEVFTKGDYPARDELSQRLGLGQTPAGEETAAKSACCSGADAA